MGHKNHPAPKPGSEIPPAAYGGPGWSARTDPLKEEIGKYWQTCGISNEWSPLKAVLLHRPGPEIIQVTDINEAQFLARPNFERMAKQHDSVATAFLSAGVSVHYVSPETTPPPNLLYVADLLLMTPEGAIVGCPASTMRAGEEIHISRRLAGLGIPILATIRGHGTFEGADAAWLDASTVLLGIGVRTNEAGSNQLSNLLMDMGVRVIRTKLPEGAMHLMGCLRFVNEQLAIARPGQIPLDAVETLKTKGIQVKMMPYEGEIRTGQALNFVTLGPNKILAPENTPESHAFFRDLGIEIVTAQVDEIIKCAGGIGCMTGVLEREAS